MGVCLPKNDGDERKGRDCVKKEAGSREEAKSMCGQSVQPGNG